MAEKPTQGRVEVKAENIKFGVLQPDGTAKETPAPKPAS